MRNVLLLCFLLIHPVANGLRICAQEPAHHPFGAENTTTIRILVLDGKTGRPIQNQEIFFDRKARLLSHAEEKNVRTNEEGRADAVVPASGDMLNPLLVDYRPCMKGVKEAGEKDKVLRLPVAKILSSGLVVPNSCGKVSHAATPGELVLFYREPNAFEKLTD